MLEKNYGLKEGELADILNVIKERKKEIVDAWREHFTN